MVAETAAQGGVKQMGRRMIGAQGQAARYVDGQLDLVADPEFAARDHAVMDDQRAELLLGVVNGDGDAAIAVVAIGVPADP